jgi:hypothetical protein
MILGSIMVVGGEEGSNGAPIPSIEVSATMEDCLRSLIMITKDTSHSGWRSYLRECLTAALLLY